MKYKKNLLKIAVLSVLTSFSLLAQSQNINNNNNINSNIINNLNDNSNPNAFIKKITTDTMNKILEDKKENNNISPERLNNIINNLIMQNVNFQKMTTKAVGRHWRLANEEQKQKITDLFKNILLKTYNGALSEITQEHRIIYKPTRYKNLEEIKEGDMIIVRTTIKSANNSDNIDLDYLLEKTNDTFKITDVNIMGAWLTTTYQSQFNSIINQNGIEGLIEKLKTM